nr:MAG TPA: hypothetical protein [Bacteriophage sp.]
MLSLRNKNQKVSFFNPLVKRLQVNDKCARREPPAFRVRH